MKTSIETQTELAAEFDERALRQHDLVTHLQAVAASAPTHPNAHNPDLMPAIPAARWSLVTPK